LVAGKKRVPNPAAGKTALRILFFDMLPCFLQLSTVARGRHLQTCNRIQYRSICIAGAVRVLFVSTMR